MAIQPKGAGPPIDDITCISLSRSVDDIDCNINNSHNTQNILVVNHILYDVSIESSLHISQYGIRAPGHP